MSKIKEIQELMKQFESIKTIDENGEERWSARKLQSLLGYIQWRRFDETIERAKISCKTQGEAEEYHFADNGKLGITSLIEPKIAKDYCLSRYGAYLVAMNGDTNKQEIAFAQAYFAVKTRTAEVIEQRIKELDRVNERKELRKHEDVLTAIAYERGVSSKGISRIRNEGDKSFFGGYSTQEMKDKLGKELKNAPISYKEPLEDYTDPIVLAGKNLATRLTVYNTTAKDLIGEKPITEEHIDNNSAVRNLIIQQTGKKPEDFPPNEDIKKIEKRIKKEVKKIIPKKKRSNIDFSR